MLSQTGSPYRELVVGINFRLPVAFKPFFRINRATFLRLTHFPDLFRRSSFTRRTAVPIVVPLLYPANKVHQLGVGFLPLL
jgi:hypothetical protein